MITLQIILLINNNFYCGLIATLTVLYIYIKKNRLDIGPQLFHSIASHYYLGLNTSYKIKVFCSPFVNIFIFYNLS